MSLMAPNTSVALMQFGTQAIHEEPGTSTTVYYIVAIMMSFAFCMGIIFNVLAIFIFARNKHLMTPTNSFVMALCVCDLCMCLFGMPIPIVNAWQQTTIRNHLLCVFDGFVVYFFGLSSMYLLAAISVDRYVVIVRPLTSFVVTQRVASLAIGTCFVVGLFWTLMPAVGWNRYVPEGIGVACSISWSSGDPAFISYIFAIFVFCLILPLVIMVVCYINIYMVIRNIARHSLWGPQSHIAQNNLRLERKMLKTIVLMLGAYLVSWTPYAVVSLSQTFSGHQIVGPVVETFPAIIAKMSAVWDPIIYIATNLQFRRAFFDVVPHCQICYCVCLSKPSVDASDTTQDLGQRQDKLYQNELSDSSNAMSPLTRGGHETISLEKRGSSDVKTSVINAECSSHVVGGAGDKGGRPVKFYRTISSDTSDTTPSIKMNVN